MGYTRTMPQIVKDKISSKLSGRTLSDETKKKISDGLRQAWSRIPKDNETINNNTDGKD